MGIGRTCPASPDLIDIPQITAAHFQHLSLSEVYNLLTQSVQTKPGNLKHTVLI